MHFPLPPGALRLSQDLAARLSAAVGQTHRIERELARGSMSRVFLATDIALGRQVVLKVLPPDLASGVSLTRFRREVELQATLQHPHILPLITAGSGGGLTWLISPFISGESLRHRITHEGPLPLDEALMTLREVADALAYAHRQGILHRDVKPENILLLEGHAVLMDFGVAHLLGKTGGGERLTDAGHAVGTPAYMSPEQFAGEIGIDERSDIYSLALVGYEMLAGRRPFMSKDLRAELQANATQRPKPLHEVRPDVPRHLSDVIQRALDPDPARRPGSATEIRDAGTFTTSPGLPAAPARSRIPLVAVIAAFVLIVMLAIAATLLLGRTTASAPGDPQVLAVLPFRISGADPSLAYLREGVGDLVYARIGDEGSLRIVSPQTVMSAWRLISPADEENLSRQSTMRLASSIGAGRVMIGSVFGSPGSVEFSAELVDPRSGRSSARASVTGRADSLAYLVESLVKELLAQDARASARELGDLTSTSLPALRAYLDAQTAYRQGRYEEAVAGYERALQHDSTFALAALGLYRAAGWLVVRGDQRERALAIGWRHRERLTARDRAILESVTGLRYPMQPLLRDRFDLGARALRYAPDLPELWYSMGDLHFHYARRVGIAAPDSLTEHYLEGAVARDSTFAGPLMHLVQLAGRSGDLPKLRRYASVLLRNDSTGEAAEFVRWFRARVTGDDGELRQMRGRVGTMGTQPLMWMVIGAQQDGIGLDDAARAAEVLERRAVSPAERVRVLQMLRDYALNRGRPSLALRYGDELGRLGDGDAEHRRRVLDALFAGGDRAAAEASATALAAATPVTPSALGEFQNACVLALRHAALGAHASSRAEAQRLRAAAAAAAGDVSVVELTALCGALAEAWLAQGSGASDLPIRLRELERQLDATAPVLEAVTKGGLLFLGRALSERGDHARAAAILDRSMFFGPSAPEYWSSFLREQGRVAEAAGNRREALRAYDAYLALRDAPEPAAAAQAAEVRAAADRLRRAH